MRILYLNPVGKVGGAEVTLLDILACLRESHPNWDLHLITGQDGPLAKAAAALGVKVEVLPFPSTIARLGDAAAGGPAGQRVGRLAFASRLASAIPSVWRYRGQLRRAIERIQPDLVHSNGLKMHILGVWSRPGNVPVIWHIHDFVSRRPLMGRLMRLFASRCARAVTNSQSVAADLKAFCPRLSVTPTVSAIDLSRFSPLGRVADLDALAGLPPAEPGTVRVGLLATMARWKGQGVFLEAVSKLPSDLPVRAYVIGGALYQTDGSQWNLGELRARAAQLGIADRVGFTGFVDQPASNMLRALDIVVHASTDPEPFGLVIVEAMACARAVIVSQAGGAAEIIHEGIDALAHKPGDAAQLAQRIQQLALDAELRERLGAEGRQTALRFFDRARLAQDLVAVYQETAGQPRRRSTASEGVATTA